MRGISPWIAMLSHTSTNAPFCGGSLIGDKWIVTAAHCLHHQLEEENAVLTEEDLFTPSSFNIILGKHRTFITDDTEQVLQAKHLILHPKYKTSTFQNDIALVELSRKAYLHDYVIPVCLPEVEVQPDNFVMVSGWGKQFLKKRPAALMEIEIPVVEFDVCNAGYLSLGRVLTEDMLCAGFKEGGKDACSGDSGGPMVTFNHQTKNWKIHV
ncbi:mannan-binding lectin serine protease 1-like [Anomaloglossus baeobatrachus]